MGQQQLLLLVLGIVIVGLAVVVGIEAFSENQRKSTQDALVNDGVRIASDVQAWSLKPAAFGPSSGQGFLDMTLGALGYAVDQESGYYRTEVGIFLLNPTAADCFQFQDVDAASYDSGLAGSPIYIAGAVTGPDPEDVTIKTDGTTPACE